MSKNYEASHHVIFFIPLWIFVTVRYQKAWREYVKFRHLLANMPKPSFEDKRKLEGKENKLQEMRTQSKMKRDVTVAVTANGFHRTGIMCDIIQVGAERILTLLLAQPV